jgi:hypothetical protein
LDWNAKSQPTFACEREPAFFSLAWRAQQRIDNRPSNYMSSSMTSRLATAAKRRIAITVIPSRAAMAGKGYNECSAQMSGAWNRAPDIAQQSQ